MKDLIDREAALNCFHSWVNQYGDVYTPDDMPEYQAIEALPNIEQPEIIHCKDCYYRYGRYCHYRYTNGLFISEDHYCGFAKRQEDDMSDLISRQAAIDAIRASTSKYTGFMEMEMYTDDDAVEAIEGLPSAQKAKGELADVNHYFLEGVQLAVDVVEGMPEPKDAENGSMPCPDARNSHDRTTDDCISRQAAIDALGERPMLWVESDYELGARNQYDADVLALETVPSAQPSSSRGHEKDAQPERKRGKWIYGEDEYGIDGYHCDKCGFFVLWDYAHKFINYIEDYNFCPGCGADMREVDDERHD